MGLSVPLRPIRISPLIQRAWDIVPTGRTLWEKSDILRKTPDVILRYLLGDGAEGRALDGLNVTEGALRLRRALIDDSWDVATIDDPDFLRVASALNVWLETGAEDVASGQPVFDALADIMRQTSLDVYHQHNEREARWVCRIAEELKAETKPWKKGCLEEEALFVYPGGAHLILREMADCRQALQTFSYPVKPPYVIPRPHIEDSLSRVHRARLTRAEERLMGPIEAAYREEPPFKFVCDPEMGDLARKLRARISLPAGGDRLAEYGRIPGFTRYGANQSPEYKYAVLGLPAPEERADIYRNSEDAGWQLVWALALTGHPLVRQLAADDSITPHSFDPRPLAEAQVLRGLKILDLGCGESPSFARCARRLGANVFTVDLFTADRFGPYDLEDFPFHLRILEKSHHLTLDLRREDASERIREEFSDFDLVTIAALGDGPGFELQDIMIKVLRPGGIYLFIAGTTRCQPELWDGRQLHTLLNPPGTS